MATNTNPTDFPQLNVPFVNKDGFINEAWFMLLVQMFLRTGGTSGAPPNQITPADVLALEETFAVSPGASVQQLFEIVFAQPSVRSEPGNEMILAPVSSQMVNESFSSGSDFTPGTTTSLTLKESFSSAAQLLVFFDGTFQGDDQYSLSGVMLTFTAAIPVGVNKVYIKGLR